VRERRHLRSTGDLPKGGRGPRPASETIGANADIEMDGGSGHAGGGRGLERIERGREVLRGDRLLADLELLERCRTVRAGDDRDQKRN
jgi:hypothetical protein